MTEACLHFEFVARLGSEMLFISPPAFLTTTLQQLSVLIATRSLKIILIVKGDFIRKRNFLKALSL